MAKTECDVHCPTMCVCVRVCVCVCNFIFLNYYYIYFFNIYFFNYYLYRTIKDILGGNRPFSKDDTASLIS